MPFHHALSRGFLLLATVSLVAMTQSSASQAQTPVETAPITQATGVTATDGGTRVIYDQAYFGQYNVVTAEDQLQRIPGIQDVLEGEDDEDRRGFGQTGDQILINGKRLSGKSNDIESALRRIQARQVLRIEVIRGAVAGLDVRSKGTVVNVVLDGTLVQGYGSWEANYTHYTGGRMEPGGVLTYTGDIGALNYMLSADTDPRIGATKRTDLFLTPADVPFERQDEDEDEFSREYNFTGNLSYSFDNGDILNLNGRYADESEVEGEDSRRYALLGNSETFTRFVRNDEQMDIKTWEIGGDYEHVFDSGDVFKSLFVYTTSTFFQEATFAETPAVGPTVLEERQLEESDSSEKILRGSYRKQLAETQSIEGGGELALNKVDQITRLFEDAGGALVEVPLFNQQSVVKETRGEVFVTHTWQPRVDLLVESAVDAEYSKLKQEGADVNESRDFTFLKPRLDVRYDLSPLTQLRFKFERTVSQLDFGDFVARFGNDDNRTDVVNAGNPDLVPEKAWVLELAYEHRLPEDAGTFSVRGFYNDITDRIEPVPILIELEDGTQEIVAGPGNLGNGKLYGLEVKSSLRLDGIGLAGAVVEGTAVARDTRITDPFTGEKRKFNQYESLSWSIGYRQDVPWQGLSYGVTVFNEGSEYNSDIDFYETYSGGTEAELFAEIQPFSDITFRLTVEEVLRSKFHRERFLFDGNRADGVLDQHELRVEKPGREIMLSVRGVF